MFEVFSDLIRPFICDYNNGNCRESAQYRRGSRSEATEMRKSLLTVFFACALVAALPAGQKDESSAKPVHIIKPPVRCPEGTKPDANGRCRVVWERSGDGACPDGEPPGEDGACGDAEGSAGCAEDECGQPKSVTKRDAESGEREDRTEASRHPSRRARTEAPKSEKPKRRRDAEEGKAAKQARSKHAFIMMLKKKKMQMMKPKPKPPPHHPPHHHPPHQQGSQERPEEEPQEQPEEEDQPQDPQRLFFGDEACVDGENSTRGCPPDAEILGDPDPNKEFKEWKPEKSSESSESSSSSSSSSSSDSAGESESEGGSGESEDEVLEKAVKIKLMKLFRMKQRYGPALRRWLATQLREYEDRKEKKEIISTRCLEAVKETMEVIKDNLEVEGLFTTSGNLRTRKKIQSYLCRGDIYTLRNWGFEFVVECAAALKIFLQNLPQPLIPIRIQQLVVAENSGVPEKTIANDALGLLKEEVNGRHKELLLEVFTFLKEAAVKVNTSELTGCNLPLKLLPVFFEIESNDPQKFRDIATVFHEIIMEAPEHLKTPCRKIPSGELQIIERILSQDMRMPGGALAEGRNGRNQPTGETAEWRIPVPRVPHTRLHPWLGRAEHSTSA